MYALLQALVKKKKEIKNYEYISYTDILLLLSTNQILFLNN